MAVLLLVYHLFLEKEKMHRFNRWYLLGSIVFAFVVPFISISIQSTTLPVISDNYFAIPEQINTNSLTALQPSLIAEKPHSPIPILPITYCLITVLLLIRFTRNLYRLLSAASKNKSIAYRGSKLVLLKEKVVSHTFLNNIFINEEDFSNKKIEEELFTHELAHVKQKHSLDIIFLEILQTLFWFNPLFILYKKAIQLNHEFLADDAVIKTYQDIPAYQFLLLEKISLNSKSYLASAFNYSVTKKRLVMMTRTSTRRMKLIKQIAVLPLLTSAIFVFSSKNIKAASILHFISTDTIPAKGKKQDTIKPINSLFYFFPGVPFTKEGVSKELLDEFNTIVKKGLYTNSKGFENFKKSAVTAEERNRLESIFKQMSHEQQSEAKIVLRKKSSPTSIKVPTEKQFESWKNADNYGVWINEKKITNDELNKYKPSDFSNYFVSNLYYTDKMKKNVMESFNLKKMYKFQLNLYTNKYVIDSNKRLLEEPEFTLCYHITSMDGRRVNGIWPTD
jgi:beta-lactamase regulating signal transducer with metallopeptidase domain